MGKSMNIYYYAKEHLKPIVWMGNAFPGMQIHENSLKIHGSQRAVKPF